MIQLLADVLLPAWIIASLLIGGSRALLIIRHQDVHWPALITWALGWGAITTTTATAAAEFHSWSPPLFWAVLSLIIGYVTGRLLHAVVRNTRTRQQTTRSEPVWTEDQL